jgi:hypothetical protein
MLGSGGDRECSFKLLLLLQKWTGFYPDLRSEIRFRSGRNDFSFGGNSEPFVGGHRGDGGEARPGFLTSWLLAVLGVG